MTVTSVTRHEGRVVPRPRRACIVGVSENYDMLSIKRFT
jgi:hypothetical protein